MYILSETTVQWPSLPFPLKIDESTFLVEIEFCVRLVAELRFESQEEQKLMNFVL